MERLTREDWKNADSMMWEKIDSMPVSEDVKNGVRQIAKKLAEYEDLEEKGMLLKPVCAVGDKIWTIVETANETLGMCTEVDLQYPKQIKVSSMSVVPTRGVLYHTKKRTYNDLDFGKIVFLTEKEAQDAIKERLSEDSIPFKEEDTR